MSHLEIPFSAMTLGETMELVRARVNDASVLAFRADSMLIQRIDVAVRGIELLTSDDDGDEQDLVLREKHTARLRRMNDARDVLRRVNGELASLLTRVEEVTENLGRELCAER